MPKPNPIENASPADMPGEVSFYYAKIDASLLSRVDKKREKSGMTKKALIIKLCQVYLQQGLPS